MSALRAFASGLRRSASGAADGRRTQIGVRTQSGASVSLNRRGRFLLTLANPILTSIHDTSGGRRGRAKYENPLKSIQVMKGGSRRLVSREETNNAATLVWLSIIVLLATVASAQVPLSTVVTKSPNLNLILQRMEDVEHKDAAQSRTYDVTREYKMFHGAEKQPASEVTAQVDFVPPDTVRYKITQTRGSSRGEQIVRYLLDLETNAAKNGRGSEISRANYDLVFLRQEDIGVIPEYVLGIVPKRENKYLLRGQIWVDASTFHIRRIEGSPAKSPSLWVKGIYITLQLGQLGSMWVPISFDAVGTVRFSGQFTLDGFDVRSPKTQAAVPQ